MNRATKQSGKIIFKKLDQNPITGNPSLPTEFYFGVKYI